jgi:serine/threonine protein kinase
MIGSGREGCVIREGDQAYKVMYSKDDVAMNREVQINNRIRALDPEQKRFVVPSNTFRIDLDELERTRPDLFRVFVTRCLETPERPPRVYIGFMPVLQKLEDGLSSNQKEYVRESIEFLHRNGISHNDIHKDNVMIHSIGGTQYPVIIDFGRAGPYADQVADDHGQFSSFIERPPPEKTRKRRYDED